MATVPKPYTQQTVPPAGAPVLAYTVPSNVELATLSVRCLNDGGQVGNYSWWLVPVGETSIERRHRQQSDLPLAAKASNVDMGYAVSGGYSIYVSATVDGMVFTINGTAHLV